MKHSKKFAAMMAALTLTACSIAPMFSFATDEKYTITVGSGAAEGYEGDEAKHTYEAYQIFKGTVEIGEDGEPTGKLEGIEWGSAITETGIYAELAKITVDGKNPFTEEEGNALTSAAEVAAALGSANDDSDLAKAFADAIGANLKENSGTTITKDEVFEGGYYLIQDEKDSPDGVGTVEGAKTRYILKVVGDVTIKPKSGVPSVEKKVVENVKTVAADDKYSQGAYTPDSDYLNDVADYCISDTVPFELIGTLPDAYADYKTYFYQFSDTLGSQFNDPTDIKVYAVNAGADEVEITTSFTPSAITENENGAKVFTLTCNDLKGINGVTIDKDTVIVVRYNAVLNATANIGLPGQENEVDLTYSRNPNYKGEGENTPEEDKGKTPKDKVIVFTYELDTTKYLDKVDDAHKAADGQAGFKLFRTVDGVEQVATLENNRITGWVDVTEENKETAGTQIETIAGGEFNFIGLDDGTYTLKETKVPTGYNKMDDLVLTIDAETANNQSWVGGPEDALTALKLSHGSGDNKESKYDANKLTEDTENAKADNLGIVRDEIINKSGSTLPSTGGIGTTIFYLGGGAMVAVAGVFLITKKRMGKREN